MAPDYCIVEAFGPVVRMIAFQGIRMEKACQNPGGPGEHSWLSSLRLCKLDTLATYY
jgi:hypothetical protein